MGLYLPAGWVDIRAIFKHGLPFNFLIGGRGIGKTYSLLDYFLEMGTRFVYMRRTEKELRACSTDKLNPLKAINRDRGTNYRFYKESDVYSICDSEATDGSKWKATGDAIGIAVALSTFANIRGFDGTDFDVLFYDEFIPERRARPIRDEFDALMNAYETINRNREIQGKPPLILICASNSNKLDNPIFLGLGLVSKIFNMYVKEQELAVFQNRGLLVANYMRSPISERKRETALYKLTTGTEFAAMALANSFTGTADLSAARSMPLREYTPLVCYGELCLYAHKSNGSLYATTHRSGNPPTYGTGETEKKKFKIAYSWIWYEFMAGSVIFESVVCELLLTNAFK